jgi:3-oxoacyl-[acyl-carrier protein] reductase
MGLLDDRVAVVTGAGRGIGRACALTFVREGARVVINDVDDEPLAEAKAACEELRQGSAATHRGSVADPKATDELMKTAVDSFGKLDILVNNAGLGFFKKLVDFDLASFEKTFATNVTGAMLMGREAARYFVQQNRGNIVNIGSTASHRGAPNGTAYYASKFALRGMTECWRQELRKNNIRVFLVNPSEVITSFGAAAGFEQKDNHSKLRAEDIGHAVKSVLEMEDRGFVTELTVFATNPLD